MLERHLTNAIKELEILITLTQEDIDLIKEANHAKLSEKHALKKHALRAFESTKSLLNHALSQRTSEGDTTLEAGLSDEENHLLDSFKTKLLELKEVNLHYSKLVISVNEFYGTLFDSMFKFDSQGYQKTNPLPAAMLQVSA